MILTVLYANGQAGLVYLEKVWKFKKVNLSSPLAKLEAAGYVQLAKSCKGKYPLTVCSLTKKGREAFEGYAQQLKLVSRAAAAGNVAKP
jgi:DNA-binding MarR family transcriptional regulator